MRKTFIVAVLMTFLVEHRLSAAEESLDLTRIDQEQTRSEVQASLGQTLKVMGRVDLTFEHSPNQQSVMSDELKNYHFLLFLKAKASAKVNFMGEFVRQSFFDVGYQASEDVKIHFGKILVPFGDTRRFHHLYGGLQGYGAKGVMFPNIWAEPGVNAEFELGKTTLDAYLVNGFTQTSPATDLDLSTPSNGTRQAVGVRAAFRHLEHLTLIASGYFEEWLPGRPVYLYGGDVMTDYGFLNSPAFKHLRVGLGLAQADIREGILGPFQKTGDYLEFASDALTWGEVRLRYGTYVNDQRTPSNKDVHNFNLGFLTPIDVLHLGLEYQWNYEAVNEINNDVFRAMVSLDF